MTPQTAAGRALLDLFIADAEVPGQLDWKRMGDSIAAIEREAAEQAVAAIKKRLPLEWWADIDAAIRELSE